MLNTFLGIDRCHPDFFHTDVRVIQRPFVRYRISKDSHHLRIVDLHTYNSCRETLNNGILNFDISIDIFRHTYLAVQIKQVH